MALRLYTNAEGDRRWFTPGEEPKGYAEKAEPEARAAKPANKSRQTRSKRTTAAIKE